MDAYGYCVDAEAVLCASDSRAGWLAAWAIPELALVTSSTLWFCPLTLVTAPETAAPARTV